MAQAAQRKARARKLDPLAKLSIPPQRSDFYPLDAIHPWVSNPRKNAHAVPRVVRSIKRWGWGRPLVVNTHPKARGELVIGHTARLAALELGLTEVPVRWVKLSPRKAHALATADNRTSEFSEWDADLLRELRTEGDLSDRDLLDAGFSENELAALTADPGDAGGGTTTRAAKRGDLWVLGPHRLVIGDAQDETIRARVLHEDEPALIVTQPRWADQLIAAWEEITGRKARRRKA